MVSETTPSWLAPLATVLAALTAASFALVGGLTGAWATQHFTRKREDRVRLIQQKREIAAGSVAAFQDYISLVEKEELEAAEWRAAADASNGAWNYIRSLEERRNDHMQAGRADVAAALQTDLDVRLPIYTDLRARTVECDKSHVETRIQLQNAVNKLNYWNGMLRLSFASETVEAYEDLCDTTGDAIHSAQEVFLERVNAHLVLLENPPSRIRSWWKTFVEILSEDLHRCFPVRPPGSDQHSPD